MDLFIAKSKLKFNNTFSYEKLNYISTKSSLEIVMDEFNRQLNN